MRAGWLTPRRQRGVELLDLPETPDAVRAAAMRDLERSNRLFGGTAVVTRAVRALLPGLPDRPLLLDVATGTADIPARLRRLTGGQAFVIGLDHSSALLRDARPRVDGAVTANALRLPFRDSSVDVVICSQALHHFFGDELREVVAELHRVARRSVIVADIRRSRLAAAAFQAGARLFRFHPVTRRDGVTSVLRGFTPSELRALVTDVTGITPVVRGALFWRLSATWRKVP